MKTMNVKLASIALAFTLALVGCSTKVEEGKHYAILKGGQSVSGKMKGWVAVPPNFPAKVENKDKGLTYFVLSGNNVIDEGQDNHVAMPPAFFTKLTGLAVETPANSGVEKVMLGKKVPEHATGWLGLPYSEPKIEASSIHKDRQLAELDLGNVVPKDMHGWVAVDRDTLSKLVKPFMLTGSGSKTENSKK